MKKLHIDRRAISSGAIGARIDLIAHERGLPRSEIKKAKSSDEAQIHFALRHDLSVDWLIFGDLRGLLRMVRWKRVGFGPFYPFPNRKGF
jgi:hypothetical protein